MEKLAERLKKNPKLLHRFNLKYSLDYWSHNKRGFENPPHIQEWCGHIDKVIHGGIKRLCVIAPRDHAKSEVFAINTITYLARYGPYLKRPIYWVSCFRIPRSRPMRSSAGQPMP